MCRVKEEEEERLEEEGGSVNHSGVCVCVSVCVSECGSEVFLSTAEGKNVNSLTRPILFITITIIATPSSCRRPHLVHAAERLLEVGGGGQGAGGAGQSVHVTGVRDPIGQLLC